MGGNLFKDVETPRMSREVYERRCRNFFSEMTDVCRIPTVFGDKEDFGDIDVVGLMTPLEFVGATKPDDMVFHDKTTVSILLSDSDGSFQVDYRKVPYDSLNFATRYFSNNDLGNLIGRIAHRIGLKFGFDGLVYCLNDGTRRLGELVLTTDFNLALHHLGFPTTPETFATRLDAFDWVRTSKFFEAAAYPLEHQSHRARVRDRKRPTYNAFIEYLAWSGYDLSYIKSNPDQYFDYHVSTFPQLKVWYDERVAEVRNRAQFKELFGGSAVREVTGLDGRDLGDFMNAFNSTLNDTELSRACTRGQADVIISCLHQSYENTLEDAGNRLDKS